MNAPKHLDHSSVDNPSQISFLQSYQQRNERVKPRRVDYDQ